MQEVPEFWRTEIWHPLSVHLPIALLLVATFFKLFERILKKEYLNKGGNILLLIGVIGAWAAIYTGDLADGVVGRKICDPTVLKSHENASYTTTWIFTSAFIAVVILSTEIIKKFRSLLKWLVVLLMFVGSGFLLYTGHLGAELVYQQGAGVYHPSKDCGEFGN